MSFEYQLCKACIYVWFIYKAAKRVLTFLRRLVVKFCLILGIIAVIALVISLVLHFPSKHYSITVEDGFSGTHGKSLLYLTLGILFWFIADLSLAYAHNEEEQVLVVSFADTCWIVGYVFFSLHLFTALRFVRRDQVHTFSAIMVVIASGSVIAYD